MRSVSQRIAAVLVMLSGAVIGGCSARHINWDNPGAPPGTGFQTKSFEFEGQRRYYTVFIPYNYDGKTKFPVIMFLHGVLEGGNDGRKCVTVGLGPEVNNRAATFPFVVVFPQSDTDWQGDYHTRLAMATLDLVLRDYPGTDPDRVFLTGLSNGGDGTWTVGAAHPERFAGLAPMCSAVNYDDAPRLTRVPIWCFHNTMDPFRSCGAAREMCDRINRLGGSARFTEYFEMGHDCWTRAYSEGEVFDWMLSLRRGAPPPDAAKPVAGRASDASRAP